MKIMAIDYGDAHTGIAISDYTETLAGHMLWASMVVRRSSHRMTSSPVSCRSSAPKAAHFSAQKAPTHR